MINTDDLDYVIAYPINGDIGQRREYQLPASSHAANPPAKRKLAK
jgi:hypothetical protein